MIFSLKGYFECILNVAVKNSADYRNFHQFFHEKGQGTRRRGEGQEVSLPTMLWFVKVRLHRLSNLLRTLGLNVDYFLRFSPKTCRKDML